MQAVDVRFYEQGPMGHLAGGCAVKAKQRFAAGRKGPAKSFDLRLADVLALATTDQTVIRTAAAAWLYPSPELIMTTRSPRLILPSSMASSNAMGMQAEPV
jgi:hypothetical protein